MANTSESTANFIQGLSDLWIRFFKDHDQLRAMYEGTEIVVGQAYLDLMSTILNISVRETPVFQKEFFKFIPIREDKVSYRSSDGRYVFEVTDYALKACKFLYNKIFSPTTILEDRIDFEVDTSGDADYIAFYKDPFDWEGDGKPIPGVAYRTVKVTDNSGTITEQRELAVWIPDAKVDRFDLYLNYGYLVKRFEPSSEAYRALLQGIIRYFVLGPTLQHLTSALNVIVGLPVVRDDGEVLQSVDTSVAAYNTVVTNRHRYQFDVAIPLRNDIEDVSNWGTLTFQAFEHLTTVFTVHDTIVNPTWWFDTTIPPKILPDEPKARRVIDPNLYENTINNPPGIVKIGDPGFFVGADYDGFVPTSRPAYRHVFSFVVFERFLRHHTFAVEFDSNVLLSDVIPFPRLDLDIQQIIIAGRSAYTVLYLEPGLQFTDSLYIASDTASDLDVGVGVLHEELVIPVDGSLTIGEKSWKVGDYYYYGIGSIVVKNESTDPIGTRFADGKTPVVVGGSDPTHRTRALATGTGTYDGNELDVGSDVFDETDVGKWIRKGSSGNDYYEIQAVISAQVAQLDGTWASESDDWTLYEYENGHEVPGYVDWGVQIKVESQGVEVWLGGDTIYAWTGSALVAQETTAGHAHRAVWAAALNDAWAVGDEGSAIPVVSRWNGSAWSDMGSLPSGMPPLKGLYGFSASDVWMCGDKIIIGPVAFAYRWDGSAWHTELPGRSDIYLRAVWGPDNSDVWIVGGGTSGQRRVFRGSAGTMAEDDMTMDMDSGWFNGVWGTASSNVLLVGANGWSPNAGCIHRWDGDFPTKELDGDWQPDPAGFGELFSVWGFDASNVWAVGDDVILYYNGSSWAKQTFPGSGITFRGVWGTAADDVFAVGYDGSERYLYHWDGSSWAVLDSETTSSSYYACRGV